VSRGCKQIDGDVTVLRTRRLNHQPFVYVWLDATYVHMREAGPVLSNPWWSPPAYVPTATARSWA
jgi:putative transposase